MTEVRGSPLVDRITAEAYARIRAGAREVLAAVHRRRTAASTPRCADTWSPRARAPA